MPAITTCPSVNFINRLIAAGAIPPGQYQKVVIEADVGGQVLVYTKTLADEKMLDVKFEDVPLVVVESHGGHGGHGGGSGGGGGGSGSARAK